MSRSITGSALSQLLPVRDWDASTTTALEVDDLKVAFGGVKALTGVNATVSVNAVTAVVGPNGAGKTTLLNAVSGLLNSSATGSITMFGTEVREMRPVQIAGLGLSRAFQHPPLLENESVMDNILIAAHGQLPYGLLGQLLTPWRTARYERQERERAFALLDLVGLAGVADSAASSLSYGARKLVDIIRAIFPAPRLLALDEPTSGLDSQEQGRVLELIQAAASLRRMTVLLVEHHMDIVRACGTQVLGMAAGRVVAVGTPDEVFDSPAYRDILVGASPEKKIGQVS